MERRAKQLAQLRSTIAESRRLLAHLQCNSQEIDEIWAARKDAVARGRGRGPDGGWFEQPFPQSDTKHEAQDAPPDLEHSAPTPVGKQSSSHGNDLLLIVDDDQDDFALLERA